MSTLTTKAPAKRRGRPAKQAQTKERTLLDILVDPAEKLAADDAKAAHADAVKAAADKDAAVYAEMRRIKTADETKEAARLQRETAAMAPIVRAAAAIAKLPRDCGGFAARTNSAIITVPGGGLVELKYCDSDSERPIAIVSEHRDYNVNQLLSTADALTWLMRTAISFGVKLPQE